MAIVFRMGNKDLDPARIVWYNVRREGRIYVVENEEIEFMPLAVLSQALGRTSRCIKDWELQCQCGNRIYMEEDSDGIRHRRCRNEECTLVKRILPRPLFEIEEMKKRRYYTAMQVMNLHNLAHFRYKARRGGMAFKIAAFSEDVHRVWRHYDTLVVDNKGNILI